MQYLDQFTLASSKEEDTFVYSAFSKSGMSCYSTNLYPFGIFPKKGLQTIHFSPITVFYGGNGSGKSTLLNIIAQKLSLHRHSLANLTPFFADYLELCKCKMTFGDRAPDSSAIITSDDVFDFLLDVRAINEGVDRHRETLFEEYAERKNYFDRHGESFRIQSLQDYAELRKHNDARRHTKSDYTRRRLPENLTGKSNGESAFAYFTQQIQEDALYLLDEPENSLSVALQTELARFLEESVRFYRCQFIISTHSPFLLSLKDATVYDLDANPAVQKRWSELENMRTYHSFFKMHDRLFQTEE